MKFFFILLIFTSLASAHEEECRDNLPHAIQNILAIQPHLGHFSVTDNDVRTAHCSRKTPFSDGEMKEWIAKNSNSQKVNRTVNGIAFQNETPANIEAFRQLTTAIDFYGRRENSRQKTFNSNCKSVQCAVDEIFGSATGTQLLFMQRKFGMNGSHIASNNASPWRQSELNDILLTLSDYPQNMLPVQGSRPLIKYAGQRPRNFERAIADSHIRIYDSWNSQSKESKRITLAHEIGHVIAGASQVDKSPLWRNMSGWRNYSKITNGQRQTVEQASNSQAMVSGYGSTNAQEDMAESINAYRYNPEKLKRASPQKYHLIQTLIFDGVEYTSENACRNPDNYSKRVLNYANKRAEQWQPTDSELALIANGCSSMAMTRLGNGPIDVYSTQFLECYKKSLNTHAQKFIREGLPNHEYAAYMGPLLRNIGQVRVPQMKMYELTQKAADIHRNNLRATVRSAFNNNDNFKPDCTRQSLSNTYMRVDLELVQVERSKLMKPMENMALRACYNIKATNSIRRTLNLNFSEEEIQTQVQTLVK